MHSIFLITFLFSFLFVNNTFAQFGGPKDLLKIETYKSLDKISPGGEFKFAVKVIIKDSWHINSNKPYEDFLIPTEFNIEENPYFKLKKIVYPNPQDVKLAFSDKPLSVLQNEILIGTLVETSDQIKQGEYPLAVVINYQACNDRVCLPPSSVKDTIVIRIAEQGDFIKEINQDIFKNINLSYSAAEVKQAE